MDQFDKNIIGYEATKQRLRQLCDILRNKHYYEEKGASLPHGLLLHSAPGLGKTLMAKTLMDASGRYSRILRKENEEEAFLKSLRDAFNDAKEHSPSILLLEDINLYADTPSPYGSQWACLQSCIDNVKDDDVFVIATTNATQCIPASLLRPGRFDLTITLEPPQGEVAEQIATHYLKGRPLDDDVVISDVVRAMGSSASCAMLESVMNAASIKSCFRNGDTINKSDLTDAILEVIYQLKHADGEANPNIEQIALHEAGHVVAAEVLKPGSVSLVTLLSDLGKQGMTQYYHDSVIFTEEDLLGLATNCLAGKAAVEVQYGLDVGASEDIQTALEYIHSWITALAGYGFAHVVFGCQSISESAHLANEKLASAKLDELYRSTQGILRKHKDFLLAVQKALLERKTLLRSDIEAIRRRVDSDAPPARQS